MVYCNINIDSWLYGSTSAKQKHREREIERECERDQPNTNDHLKIIFH